MTKRIVLTLILLCIAIISLVLGILVYNTSNAPLQLGNFAQDKDVPLGTVPNDLLLITDMTGDWDIALLKTDGTLLNLTADDSGAHDILGSFSFDGQVVNFLSNRMDSEETAPSQVKIDGSDLRNLTLLGGVMTVVRDQLFDWDATWSPDGTQLAWVSVRDLNLEIYSITLDEEFDIANAIRRTDGNGRSWYPAWSPDGTQIVFNNNRDGNENLYMLDVASGDITRLTDHPEHDLHGAWLLDGSGLIFVRDTEGAIPNGILNVYRMDTDGSNQRPLGDDEIIQVDPVWSANGSHIAYMSNEEGHWNIYVMEADGSHVQRVTAGDANFLLPTWKP
jgi:Tol biopolymer transport system component